MYRATYVGAMKFDDKACSPAPVDKLHWLHRQRRGNNIISIMPTASHHHEAVHLPRHKDQTCRSDKAQQASSGEGKLTDGSPAVGHGEDLGGSKRHKGEDERPSIKPKNLFSSHLKGVLGHAC